MKYPGCIPMGILYILPMQNHKKSTKCRKMYTSPMDGMGIYLYVSGLVISYQWNPVVFGCL